MSICRLLPGAIRCQAPFAARRQRSAAIGAVRRPLLRLGDNYFKAAREWERTAGTDRRHPPVAAWRSGGALREVAMTKRSAHPGGKPSPGCLGREGESAPKNEAEAMCLMRLTFIRMVNRTARNMKAPIVSDC